MLVPIPENLRLRLEPYRKVEWEMVAYHNITKQLLWLAESVDAARRRENPPVKFEWERNALRHSFISYRVAQTQNGRRWRWRRGASAAPSSAASNGRAVSSPTARAPPGS
ncbi:MAG TPA: hypothetical protein VNT26_04970 [Candidatus Sulfotelmatobacter sp.]|nr:hypothetical protein [Candidatus Sulfotelmatobacter sp.]